jgi:nucleoside-diphosphate-sugar epimerase
MRTAFVTGVAGFTGRHLALALQARGYRVCGLVQDAAAANALPGVDRLCEGDLLDAGRLSSLLDEERPEVVVHLAAVSFVAHGDVEAIYRTNLIGTRCLLDALARRGSVRHVLLASSANVYGNAVEGMLDESSPPAPANDYAVSKLAMEHMARLWMHRLPITLVRPFNYTGVGQAAHFLVPKIVGHFARRAPVLELGNLEVERDFSDVRTVVEAYVRLLEQPAGGQIYNVCSGQGHSLMDILSLLERQCGFRPEVQVNPAFVRPNEVRRLVGNPARLLAAVGPLPTVPLTQTLAWMLNAEQAAAPHMA